MEPKISIIIVNYNGKRYLKDCLSSITENSYKNYEVIFVDNGSSDGSVDYVAGHFPQVKIVKNEENLGFAGGNNAGVKLAKGDFVLLINNDTRIERDFLTQFVRAFLEIPNLGCAQSKIVLMANPEKIDSCGSFLTDALFLYHYGYDKDQALLIYNEPFPIFSAKGASMLIRKEVIDKVGLFDDDFWCYYEETDFCHRLWLAGYESWYYPKAKIYHALGGTSLTFDNSYVQFQNFKNKLLSYLKNFEGKTLIKVIPGYLFINMGLSFYWLFLGKPKHFFSLYRAIGWNLSHLPKTMAKRKKIQLLRSQSDEEIFKKVKINPGLSYYYYQFHGLENYKDRPILK